MFLIIHAFKNVWVLSEFYSYICPTSSGKYINFWDTVKEFRYKNYTCKKVEFTVCILMVRYLIPNNVVKEKHVCLKLSYQ
jgi:hypothetical protein